MVWAQLAIDKPHLVYIILGGFTSLFMLCSTVIKERLYIGEATVATLCGIIFGPHAANLIDPGTWGNTDQITLEFARIVLVVQCFAVGVELPKAYMERHWRSVVFLLVPVMTFGWLITSVFVWGLIPGLNWLDSLTVAACVTATDPVLASSVVGKGKFAKRVPRHLRDLLSAESGCNDGMAFPFIYLALYLLRYRPDANQVAFHWFCYTILYECVFGAFYGVCVGYIARHAIRWAHERDIIDRESFLVFYFVLALFCAGSGSMLGMDDLLIGFACGVGFSNDGWFTEKTEESHVSNVIDLLINLAFFVYFGTIIPWAQYNEDLFGLKAWRLVVIGLLVLLFRRIPIMLALKPLIPDIKTWREALFAGHFGPIGVGALFVAILARAELETDSTTPLAELPEPSSEHYNIIALIWPVTTFLVICSIIVHGSSIAVFTLGKHINTLTLTLSYTQANEETTNWMDRLPRIQSRSKSSMSARRPDEESEVDEKVDFPPGALPNNFLRRQPEDDNPSRSSSRRPGFRRKSRDYGLRPGGPISQSAIAPRRSPGPQETPQSRSDSETLAVKSEDSQESSQGKQPSSPSDEPDEPEGEVYEEGHETVYEDEEGNVLEVEEEPRGKSPAARQAHEKEELHRLASSSQEDVHHGVSRKEDPPEDQGEKAVHAVEKAGHDAKEAVEHPTSRWRRGMHRVNTMNALTKRDPDGPEKPKKVKAAPEQKRGPARAYQFGNTIIVEDEDGEVLKKYDIPAPEKKKKLEGLDSGLVDPAKAKQRMQRMGSYLGIPHHERKAQPGPSNSTKPMSGKIADNDDDNVRFTISTGGRRMSKADFIKQIQQLDPKLRARVVEDSDVPEAVKVEARADAKEQDSKERREAAQEGSSPRRPNIVEANGSDGDEQGARVMRVTSDDSKAGPDGLTLVDSNDQNIPYHDVSSDLSRYGMQQGTGQETAAQRRRREARLKAQQGPPPEGDSEDDGTERVPPRAPGPPVSAVSSHRNSAFEGETAAERRRREGALGVSKEESDSSEEESNEPRRPGIRFADEPNPREQTRTGRTRGAWPRRQGQGSGR